MLWGIFWSGYLDAMQYFQNQYGQTAAASASAGSRSGGGVVQGRPGSAGLRRSSTMSNNSNASGLRNNSGLH